MKARQTNIFEPVDIPEAFALLEMTRIGLFCKKGGFYLDPVRVVDIAVISHAHSDHAVRGHRMVVCSEPTAELMKMRMGENAAGEFKILKFGESFQIGNVKITLIPAGHMLGSSQVLMETGGLKHLYTGDFKVQSDASCEAFESVEADVLYTESTFAHPRYKHPDPVVEIQKLNELNHDKIMIGCYSIGKAQRLTSLISKHCPEILILVHHELVRGHKMYEKFGFDLGSWKRYNKKYLKNNAKIVYLVPPTEFRNFKDSKEFITIFATGWDWVKGSSRITLKISDHADWYDLKDVINKMNPKMIYTLHGDGKHLQYHYAMKGMKISMLQ